MKQTKEMGLCKPTDTETPRVLNWYSLTEKGQQVIEQYQREGLNPESFDGYHLKDFDLYSRLASIHFQL